MLCHAMPCHAMADSTRKPLVSLLQVYLVNVTFNIMECKAELTAEQAQLPVWCVLGGSASCAWWQHQC